MRKFNHIYLLFIAIIFLNSCTNESRFSEVKLIPVSNGKEYQFIDTKGAIIINPQFSEASIFRDGLALVKSSGENSKWGYITEDGKYKISPNYISATVFSEELAWVVSENLAPSAIDVNGIIKFTLQNAETVNTFKEGLAAFCISDSTGLKWGFVDKFGKIAINPQFIATGEFSNGKCAIQNSDGKWGYIDKEGKIIINPQFNIARKFIEGRAVVASLDKRGVIDESGKYIINPQYSGMINDGDRYSINQNGKYGWCDLEGKIIINPQFDEACGFSELKYAPVLSGKSWGFVDRNGKIAINPQFDLALSFNGDNALVFSSDKIGFIDKQGKYVINPQFDEVSKDYIEYVLYGDSHYNSVQTDYFNISSILDRLNFKNPEGLNLENNLSDVMQKLNLEESKFDKYSNEQELIVDSVINKFALYSFYVIANAFNEVEDGWYTRKVFNPNAKIQGFAYGIRLRGNGEGKDSLVMEEFEKKLIGYKKVKHESDNSIKKYINDYQTIQIYQYKSRIIIVIFKE